ncbi:MAG: PorV/PorQ family protein [Bacteroidota bacterium]
MKTRLSFICAALIVLLPPTVSAQTFNKAGRASLQFLKIGVGARQTGMGESGISVIRDVNSLFWNPAGITGISSAEASFSYSRWLADMNYVAGAAAVRWGDIGTVGVSFSHLGYGDIPEALAVVESGSSDTRTGSFFTGYDMLIGLSFARQFTDNLSVGVTGKYLHEKLFEYAVTTFAFDVGTLYDTQFKGIRFAMSAQNFSGAVKYLDVGSRNEGYDIPLLFTIGASVDVVNPGDAFINAGEFHRLTLALETVNSNDYGERWHVGGEYAFDDFLFLRGGYRFNYEEGNISLGAGIRKTLGDIDVRVDYSYVSYKFLTSPQRVTLSVGF